MYLCDCMSNLRFTRYIYMYFPNSRFQSQVGDVTQSHEHSKHWGIRIVFTLFGESLISSANKHLETSLVSTWQSASGSFPASHQYVILIDYPKNYWAGQPGSTGYYLCDASQVIRTFDMHLKLTIYSPRGHRRLISGISPIIRQCLRSCQLIFATKNSSGTLAMSTGSIYKLCENFKRP